MGNVKVGLIKHSQVLEIISPSYRWLYGFKQFFM